MATWQPQPTALNEILTTLQGSITPNNQAQQESYQRIQQFKQNHEFGLYLAHILVQTNYALECRQIAGLVLKQTVKEYHHSYAREIQTHLYHQIIQVLVDAHTPLQNAAGSILTTIVSQSGLETMPGLISDLLKCLAQQESSHIAGGFNALSKICEDSLEQLLNAPSDPVSAIVPSLLQYLHHPEPRFRVQALGCLNNVMILMPPALVSNVELLLSGISSCTQHPDSGVRKLVCQTIVILLDVGIQYLAPHLDSILAFILQASADEDEHVALEACEFWSAYGDHPFFEELRPTLEPHLPELLPLLLTKMAYGPDDIAMLEAEEAEQNELVADRPEDIKPIFHKTKDDEEEDDGGDDSLGEWNLRKCAAAGLDVLSHGFGDDLLPILLPHLQQRLVHVGHWSIRESGILALGAIGEGCMEGIMPHLPQLFPYLLQLLDDPAPLIRSITCWTLSRYAPWAVAQQDHERILRPLMETMLKRVLDHNKKVQEAACSAFCTLIEEAHVELVPYLMPIVQGLMFAFGKYQAKNLLILYDAIGTLADSVEGAMNQPDIIAVLMPPLLSKWSTIPDDSREIFPLLECLASVAQALGPGFGVFAAPIMQRCIRLIENGLLVNATSCEGVDPEFIVCSLDLISGIVEGITTASTAIVLENNLVQLVFECAKHEMPDVRQSSLALTGDLAKHALEALRPGLNQILPVLMHNLVDPELTSVCNNACWAIGEIAIQVGQDLEPVVDECLRHLVPLMQRTKLPRNLQENCAITIARLGLVCPEKVAQVLPECLPRWCVVAKEVRDHPDREHCFHGLCKMIEKNPTGVLPHFIHVCSAIASWDGSRNVASAELLSTFSRILHGFKQNLGKNWPQLFQSFPAPLRQFLISTYQL